MIKVNEVKKNKCYIITEDEGEDTWWKVSDNGDKTTAFRALRDLKITDNSGLDIETTDGKSIISVPHLSVALFDHRVFEISEDEFTLRGIK